MKYLIMIDSLFNDEILKLDNNKAEIKTIVQNRSVHNIMETVLKHDEGGWVNIFFLK